MDEQEQHNLLSEITKLTLYKLCDYTPEQLRDIRDHMAAPDRWVMAEELERLTRELAAMKEDLHSTCGVCASPDIIPDDMFGGYQCAHLDRRKVVSFGQRTDTIPPRCPHWVWRGPGSQVQGIPAPHPAPGEVLA